MRTCTEPSEEDSHKSLLAHLPLALCEVFPSLLQQLSEIEWGKLIQEKDCAHLDSQRSHIWPVLKPHAHSLTMSWQGSGSRLQTAEDIKAGSGFALTSETRVPLSQSPRAIMISGHQQTMCAMEKNWIFNRLQIYPFHFSCSWVCICKGVSLNSCPEFVFHKLRQWQATMMDCFGG